MKKLLFPILLIISILLALILVNANGVFSNPIQPEYIKKIDKAGMWNPNMRLYYRFDEGTGTKFNNLALGYESLVLTAYGRTGDAELWVTGRFNTGIYCDGINDYCLIPNNAALNFGTTSFSYSLWIYKTGHAGEFDTPIYKGPGGVGIPGYNITAGAYSSGWRANIRDVSDNTAYASFGAAILNQWVYLTAVVDRETQFLRAYKNGVQINATNISAVGSLNGTTDFFIGRSALYFMGAIEEVIVEAGALTQDEIMNRYKKRVRTR